MTEYLQRLKYMADLIGDRQTGTPEQLAVKLKLSVRTIFDDLKTLKSLGVPIDYSRKDKTYFYTRKGHFEMGFLTEL